jgi:hypothetical protein
MKWHYLPEIDGKRADIKAAIKWLEQLGVSVEPVEIKCDRK